MAPDPGPLWNHRGGQQRLGYSSLEFLTDLAAAFGPKRVFSSVEWVMKLISKKNRLCASAQPSRNGVTVARIEPVDVATWVRTRGSAFVRAGVY
jgi:hypothetical protein